MYEQLELRDQLRPAERASNPITHRLVLVDFLDLIAFVEQHPHDTRIAEGRQP